MASEIVDVHPMIRSILRQRGLRFPGSDRVAELAKWIAKHHELEWRLVLYIFDFALSNGKPGYQATSKKTKGELAKTAEWLNDQLQNLWASI